MKKLNILKSTMAGIAMTFAAGAMVSCTSGFEESNRPGEFVSNEELDRDGYSVGSFLIQMQNEAFPEQENTYQMNRDLIGNYLGRYFTYANNGFAAKNFACFNAPDGWVGYPFGDTTPKVVSAFKEVEKRTDKIGFNYAWALILRAQAFLVLTDMYGPYPIGAEEDKSAYSSQETVYKSLLADLDKATEMINSELSSNPGKMGNKDVDHVFHGKISGWYKFANSLKLRMAVRMRFADPEFARKVGEKAVADGVMMSNADNAAIEYFPNGLYKTSVEWGDTRACADLESYMAGYNDPRLAKYFLPASEITGRAIVGCRAGANVTSKPIASKIYSAANVENSTDGVWMTASEMAFCRAEGALAGWSGMGGSVEELYNEGIRLSFDQWKVSGADSYIENTTNVPADYVDVDNGFGGNAYAESKITIKWDDNASEEEKMERLITQKWIALYPVGQEGWNEIRRTGYPKVFDVAQSTSGYSIKVPNRIPFAPDEKINNKANYEKAVQLLGGKDDYATKMWWQKK